MGRPPMTPARIDLPLLRSIFKPGKISKTLRLEHEKVLAYVLEYHKAGALPCWFVQYARPELPDANSIDWGKLYARSSERFDHLKLKWWAYRHLELFEAGAPSNSGLVRDLGLEYPAFHPHFITDVYVKNNYSWPAPRRVPSSVSVECGDTEIDKLLVLGSRCYRRPMLFCVLPYSLIDLSLALVFYCGSRLVLEMQARDHMQAWYYFGDPSIGAQLPDGPRMSAWGQVR